MNGLTKRQSELVEYMKKHEWVRYKDAKENIGCVNLVVLISALENKGYKFERKRYQPYARTNGDTYEYKLVSEGPANAETLSVKQSEVLRFMTGKGFIRDREIAHIGHGITEVVRKLEEKGCVFESRTYREPRSHGTEFRFISKPDNLILTEPKRNNALNSADPKVCRIASRCDYGMSLSITGYCCNYLSIKGHSRPCLPGECKEKGIFKTRKAGNPRRRKRADYDESEFYANYNELVSIFTKKKTPE